MSFVGGCCHLHKGENHGIHHCRLPLAKRHHACVQLLGWAKPNLRNCVHAPRRRCWVWFVRQVFSWDAKRLRPHHQPSGNFCRVLPCQSDVAWHNHHKTISIVHQVALKIFSKQMIVSRKRWKTSVRLRTNHVCAKGHWAKICHMAHK